MPLQFIGMYVYAAMPVLCEYANAETPPPRSGLSIREHAWLRELLEAVHWKSGKLKDDVDRDQWARLPRQRRQSILDDLSEGVRNMNVRLKIQVADEGEHGAEGLYEAMRPLTGPVVSARGDLPREWYRGARQLTPEEMEVAPKRIKEIERGIRRIYGPVRKTSASRQQKRVPYMSVDFDEEQLSGDRWQWLFTPGGAAMLVLWLLDNPHDRRHLRRCKDPECNRLFWDGWVRKFCPDRRCRTTFHSRAYDARQPGLKGRRKK